MDNIPDCNFCKNFDFYKSKRCMESECTIIGNIENRYKYYQEVDEDEKNKRNYELEKKRIKDKEASKKYYTYKHKLTLGMILFFIPIVIMIIISIICSVYNFSHPEMTEMMMLHWRLSKYGVIDLCCVISIAIGYNLFH